MTAVQPPARVLVSGATGYIAAWVVQNLLERGYAVRGTVRSVAKGDFLKKAFASYGDRFELVVVEDIAKVSLSAARDGRSWYAVHRDRLCVMRCAVSCLSFAICWLGWGIRRGSQRRGCHRTHSVACPL